jgi:hypothetical protein
MEDLVLCIYKLKGVLEPPLPYQSNILKTGLVKHSRTNAT